jgi:Chlorophyll A-B binding protein
MKLTIIITTVALQFTLSCAFAPSKGSFQSSFASLASTVNDEVVPKTSSQPVFDPLGLYPENAPERVEGILQPLESTIDGDKTIKDPLGLYNDKTTVDKNTPMSESLPFLKRPIMLDGTLPGDRGFDPFNFAYDANALQWYRTAEIKHARLAMLAAVGWPVAELFDRKLAVLFNLRPLLVYQDRVPSVLNGGLDRTPAAYWAAVLGVAFAIESLGFIKEGNAAKAGTQYTPGDLGFDPLGLAKGNSKDERIYKSEAEIFNGRLAMLAITGFAIQEWWTQNSVINETPFFFKPITTVLEQLQDAAGNGGL